jgi:hypothetical protein
MGADIGTVLRLAVGVLAMFAAHGSHLPLDAPGDLVQHRVCLLARPFPLREIDPGLFSGTRADRCAAIVYAASPPLVCRTPSPQVRLGSRRRYHRSQCSQRSPSCFHRRNRIVQTGDETGFRMCGANGMPPSLYLSNLDGKASRCFAARVMENTINVHSTRDWTLNNWIEVS